MSDADLIGQRSILHCFLQCFGILEQGARHFSFEVSIVVLLELHDTLPSAEGALLIATCPERAIYMLLMPEPSTQFLSLAS